jgi:hypothetical protein
MFLKVVLFKYFSMNLSNRVLIKFSLIGFLFLFVFLFYLDFNFDLEKIYIKDISMGNLNDIVVIEANIVEQTLQDNIYFLSLDDGSGKIKAVLFDSNFKFDSNYYYSIEGKVTLYDKELELVVREIKLID